MEIPLAVLKGLADVGVFTPSGINDDIRKDLCDPNDPFLAVDNPGAREIDDAIRIRKQRGGHLLQVAVVDGAQLSERSDLVDSAIEHGDAAYWAPQDDPMLPGNVVNQLELRRPNRKHRATVIQRPYDIYGEPAGDTVIIPAYVRTATITTARLGKILYSDPDMRAARDFVLTQTHRNKPRAADDEIPTGNKAYNTGNHATNTCMVLANISVAEWMEERGIPSIRRIYDGIRRAGYAATSGTHTGVRAKRDVPYTHFTSPLRRPADLIEHLQIGHFQAGGEQGILYSSSDLEDRIAQFGNPHGGFGAAS